MSACRSKATYFYPQSTLLSSCYKIPLIKANNVQDDLLVTRILRTLHHDIVRIEFTHVCTGRLVIDIV